MIDYLHWLIPLSVNLLFVATIIAVASRCKTPLWRRFWPILATALTFIGTLVMVGGGIYLIKENVQPKWLIWYGLFHSIGFMVGVGIILKKGLKDVSSEVQVARSWPRVKLLLAFVFVFMTQLVLLELLQMRSMINLTSVRSAATCKLIDIAPPRLPDHLNSRIVYEEAAQIFGSKKDLPEWFWKFDAPGFDPESEQVSQFLEKHQKVLPLVKKAAAIPGYSLESYPMELVNWIFPNYALYSQLALLVCLNSRSKAMSGDIEGALQELASIEAMANHLRNSPIILSFMVGVSLDNIKVQTLEYVLAHTSVSVSGLINLPITVHSSAVEPFRNCLVLDAYAQLNSFAITAATSDIYAMVSDAEAVFENTTPVTKMWRVFFLPSELRAANLITQRLCRPAETYADIQNNLDAIMTARQSGEMGILTSIGVPGGYSRYLHGAMRDDALVGLSNMALAATAFKDTQGFYPARAEDMVPDFIDRIPLDPFDGQPLKIRAVEGGLELYSAKPAHDVSFDVKDPVHFYLGRELYEKYRGKDS